MYFSEHNAILASPVFFSRCLNHQSDFFTSHWTVTSLSTRQNYRKAILIELTIKVLRASQENSSFVFYNSAIPPWTCWRREREKMGTFLKLRKHFLWILKDKQGPKKRNIAITFINSKKKKKKKNPSSSIHPLIVLPLCSSSYMSRFWIHWNGSFIFIRS